MDKVWDNNNRGVRAMTPEIGERQMLTDLQRQWKDIRHKFLEGGDEDEE
jgi:ubiquinol-cytochrome c reductase subunit 9